MRTAWLTTKNGFLRVEIVEEGPRSRRLRFADGAELTIPPQGLPHGGFHPALYEQEQEPQVFRHGGRSVLNVTVEDFANTEQAKALIPRLEPYVFLPHTAKLLDAVNGHDHVFLVGHKGTGKTSSVLQIAARIGQPVVRLNLSGQLTVSDLVGSVGFGAGGTTWHDGPVITAMRCGYWLLVDEADFGDSSVMAIFHSILEKRPSYCLKENDGEVVVADPRFRVFATGNSLVGDGDGSYAGTQPLNAALLDRFAGHGQVIVVSPMSAKQERFVLRSLLPYAPESLLKRVVEFAAQLRAQHLPAFSTREVVNYANKTMLLRSPVEAAEVTFLPVVRDEALRKAVREFTHDWFPTRFVMRTGGQRSSGSTPTEADSRGARSQTPTVEPPKGKTAAEVNDPTEMETIWKAYIGNGGDASYGQLEKRFGLKPSRGMNAYRLVKKFEALRAVKADKTPTGKTGS